MFSLTLEQLRGYYDAMVRFLASRPTADDLYNNALSQRIADFARMGYDENIARWFHERVFPRSEIQSLPTPPFDAWLLWHFENLGAGAWGFNWNTIGSGVTPGGYVEAFTAAFPWDILNPPAFVTVSSATAPTCDPNVQDCTLNFFRLPGQKYAFAFKVLDPTVTYGYGRGSCVVAGFPPQVWARLDALIADEKWPLSFDAAMAGAGMGPNDWGNALEQLLNAYNISDPGLRAFLATFRLTQNEVVAKCQAPDGFSIMMPGAYGEIMFIVVLTIITAGIASAFTGVAIAAENLAAQVAAKAALSQADDLLGQEAANYIKLAQAAYGGATALADVADLDLTSLDFSATDYAGEGATMFEDGYDYFDADMTAVDFADMSAVDFDLGADAFAPDVSFDAAADFDVGAIPVSDTVDPALSQSLADMTGTDVTAVESLAFEFPDVSLAEVMGLAKQGLSLYQAYQQASGKAPAPAVRTVTDPRTGQQMPATKTVVDPMTGQPKMLVYDARTGQYVSPTAARPATTQQMIPGVPNTTLMIGAAVAAVVALLAMRRK